MNGFWNRVVFAFQCFFAILAHGDISDELLRKIGKAPAPGPSPQGAATKLAFTPLPPPEPPALDTSDRAVQLLAIMQRDGRLVDFLAENISVYPDAQLGAAVRSIHESCRAALYHYVTLEPVLNSEEDQPVTVQAGFEPAAIKLIGNVTGAPPVRGVLRHKGWRIKEVNLPPLPQLAARMVVAPAEVEVS